MSTSAMAHSKYLLNPSAGNVTFEGTTIDINTTSGYPALDNTLAAGAGMAQNPNNTSDYLYLGPGNTGGTTTPTTSATQIAMIPRSVVGTPTASSCAVIYTGATTANSAPTVTYPPDSTSC